MMRFRVEIEGVFVGCDTKEDLQTVLSLAVAMRRTIPADPPPHAPTRATESPPTALDAIFESHFAAKPTTSPNVATRWTVADVRLLAANLDDDQKKLVRDIIAHQGMLTREFGDELGHSFRGVGKRIVTIREIVETKVGLALPPPVRLDGEDGGKRTVAADQSFVAALEEAQL
jgi:hypothetical protein